MTYLLDFRKTVLEVTERDQISCEEVSERFSVGKASVLRGSKPLEAQPTRDKPATKIAREKLKKDVERYPDAYQYERAPRLGVSRKAIGYALKRLGISRKKPCSHPQAEIVARTKFKEPIETYQRTPQPIVDFDESGLAHDMPRRYGYAPRGKRCVGTPNWHAKGRLKVMGAWLVSCWLTVTLFTGSINANTFSAWVAQDLLPQLPPRRIVVMDNADFHHRADIRSLFEQAGHILEYLPVYSPNFNPIEHQWAQAQAIRQQKNCSIEELFAFYVV